MKKVLLFATMMFMACLTAIGQTKPPKVQCTSTKKNGEQCKGMAVKSTLFCFVHDPTATRCGFIKKDKQACKMMVKEKGEKCRFHDHQ